MHFHFCLATMPPVFRESVQDVVLHIAAGLEDCGNRITVDDARVIYGGRTVNLVIEHFEGDAADMLVDTKHAKGSDFPLGLIFTEDLRDTNVMSGEFSWRAENFRKVAAVADFIWYLIPGTELRTDIVDPAKCGFFELGYSERLATVPLQPVRDIDFFLPGLAYPRRKPVLEKLHELGYHVRATDLTTPAYIYRSLMGRAKAVLDIRRFENTRTLSIGRICLSTTNAIAVIAEAFDNADFAEMYRYTVTAPYDQFVERCIAFVEHEDPIAVGRANRERLARDRPLKDFVAALLAIPAFDRWRD
jgi:hypothetical protein